MGNLSQLEADLHRIDLRLNAIASGDAEPSDEDLAEYADLTSEREETEVAVRDERTRLRQRLNLGSEWKPPQHAIDPGMTILAGQPRDYQRLYGTPARSPWKRGEFLRVVLAGLHDPRLEFFGQMGEASGGGGGLMVPKELQAQLLDRAISQSIAMSRSNLSPMTSKTKIVAGFAASDQSTTLYGFTFQWLAENQPVTPGSGQLRAIELVAHLSGIYVSCSNELLSDATGFEAELTARLADAMAQELDSAFINGGGGGMPLGFLKSSALLVVAKETGQSPNSLVTENILRMLSHSTNAAGSVWVASPSTLVQLGMLVINVGAQAVSSTLVTQSPDGALQLAGRPLLLSHRCPLLGLQGDISLVDFSQYVIGLRAGIGIESSGAPGFTSNAMTFRCLTRIDGQPLVSRPYTGEDQRAYSPFVTLALRA